MGTNTQRNIADVIDQIKPILVSNGVNCARLDHIRESSFYRAPEDMLPAWRALVAFLTAVVPVTPDAPDWVRRVAAIVNGHERAVSSWPNMDQTRTAMRAYDNAVAALMGCDAHNADARLREADAAWCAVLDAFAFDTASYNQRSTIMACKSAPFFESFLRGILRGAA
jgi:hypothetical protein